MIPKHHKVLNPHNIGLPPNILLLNIPQYLQLHQRLFIKILLILDNLQRSKALPLMVIHLNNLSERSLSYHLMHLISISYMVSHYKLVVVLFGLEIGEYLSNLWLYFVCLMTYKVHILVIEYFSALVGCQVLLVPL